MIIRARHVLPLTGTHAIEDGAVQIQGNRIIRVDQWKHLAKESEPVTDTGEVVLLPGLINSHCHLDYTAFGGKIPPQSSFRDWIGHLTGCKSGLTAESLRDSWLEGARMLEKTGTTCVLDIEAYPDQLQSRWNETGLRVLSFVEMIHINKDVPVEATLGHCARYLTHSADGIKSSSLSPHAPYSTTPELLRESARLAQSKGLLMSIHVAESNEENEMFRYRKGPMFDWLAPQRNMDDCGGRSPVEVLYHSGCLNENCLAVHANVLDERDVEILADQGVTVSHCPGSHDYFGHPAFPYEKLKTHHVNLCLGTDSLASMPVNAVPAPRLSMFDEMQRFARLHPTVSPLDILSMCTTRPAKFLKRRNKLGVLAEGAFADMIGVPFYGPAIKAVEHVVHHQGDVSYSMINGRIQDL